MHVHHIKQAADSCRDLRPFGSEALSVFPPDAVIAELRALRKHAELPLHPEPVDDLEDDEWQDLMTSFTDSLGATLEIDTCRAWGRAATDRTRQATACQIQRALKAVRYAAATVDEHGSATGLLLPTSFSKRIVTLIGHAVLPMAWVRRLDVLRF